MKKIIFMAALAISLSPQVLLAQTVDQNDDSSITQNYNDIDITEVNPENSAFNFRIACYAQNAHGQVFRAHGFNKIAVQRRALHKCYQASLACRYIGCKAE